MLIRLGTRQSALALWQAEYVSHSLRTLGHEVQLVKITTSGDVSTTPLGESGGQGVFTKEIQRALLDDRCDLAVHSLKDLPTEVIAELVLAAVPPREDTSDCLLSKGMSLAELPLGASIGTGSPRRKASLLNVRPDLLVKDIRGNVDTRIKKLEEGQYDAILLAFAGLHRLGLQSRITQKFTSDEMLPAVGQAALGLETRFDDKDVLAAVQELDHLPTHAAVLAERTLLRSMRAGCLAPLACNAIVQNNSIQIVARVYSSDGKKRIEVKHSIDHQLQTEGGEHKPHLYRLAEQLGRDAAEMLIVQGAVELIQEAKIAP
ncbi:MAG: hydroxymethylbilane synthase [Planctomycetota bacterium]|jgi:hydroxymethylbilane synthase|nr:hydroxymethylbilane synthase [Planctomycetota bacterium]